MHTRIALSLSTLLACAANASTVSFKFTDAGQDTTWGTASAGAPGYAASNWNFLQTDWSGNPENDAIFTTGLVDSTGSTVSGFGGSLLQNVTYAPHSDALHYDAANTWRSGAGNSTPNHTLMNGYLDDGTDNQPYANLSLATIPGTFETYDVVLYVNGDNPGGANGRYWIESWTDSLTPGTVITEQVGVTNVAFGGTFTSAGSFASGASGNVSGTGNYIVFTGLTDRNIRIRSAGNGDPEDFGRGPLNGFQLVDTTVPEPSTALLGSLGLLALMRRRK
jgi:hypothetical protein